MVSSSTYNEQNVKNGLVKEKLPQELGQDAEYIEFVNFKVNSEEFHSR